MRSPLFCAEYLGTWPPVNISKLWVACQVLRYQLELKEMNAVAVTMTKVYSSIDIEVSGQAVRVG
jgi:hypothetical protein